MSSAKQTKSFSVLQNCRKTHMWSHKMTGPLTSTCVMEHYDHLTPVSNIFGSSLHLSLWISRKEYITDC